MNIYAGGRLPLFHLDLYRLETRGQIIAAGLEEYLTPAGVTVVEWAERWGDLGGSQSAVCGPEGVGGRFCHVRIEVLGESERRISYEDSGA